MNETQLRGPRRCLLYLLLTLAVSGCGSSAGGAAAPTVVGVATAAAPGTAQPGATDAPATETTLPPTRTPAGAAPATSPPSMEATIPLTLTSAGTEPATPPPPTVGSTTLPLQQAAFTLDGIPVQIRSPFLPAPTFALPAPDNAIQVATASAGHPYREFGVTAVAFGRKPGTEALPVAQAGGATVYRTALHDTRVAQGGQPQPGPTATLFGQAVPSEVNLVPLHLDSATLQPTLIVEWVVEAQGHLWIVRVAQEQPAETTDVPANAPWLDALGALIVQ